MDNQLKSTIKSFLTKGKIAEREFSSLFNNVVTSTEEEDMKGHFDLKVVTKIDVKGLKKIRRNDSEVNENYHYLEIKSVNGQLGWLYAEEVDCFAFELKNYWIVVDKTSLQELVKESVKKEYTPNPQPYKLYQRSGRKDVMTLISSYDLCYLAMSIIKK